MDPELEQPLIRPPSESRSVLVRLTRGCRWNRCRFCGIYPALGEPGFSVRTAVEVDRDIERLKQIMPAARTAFIGDADPLQAGLDAFIRTASRLRERFRLERLTAYARVSTLDRLERGSIRRLAGAGLNRLHIGLESGDPETLRFHRKGHSPDMVRRVAARLKGAGIEISFYVLLGMAGADGWRRHAVETAKLVNDTEPEFLRLRRLWIYGSGEMSAGRACPLREEVRAGRFTPRDPEGTVLELRLLLENLDESLSTEIVSDHRNNYVDVSGVVKTDKQKMLDRVEAFLARPEPLRRAHYESVGSGL